MESDRTEGGSWCSTCLWTQEEGNNDVNLMSSARCVQMYCSVLSVIWSLLLHMLTFDPTHPGIELSSDPHYLQPVVEEQLGGPEPVLGTG